MSIKFVAVFKNFML